MSRLESNSFGIAFDGAYNNGNDCCEPFTYDRPLSGSYDAGLPGQLHHAGDSEEAEHQPAGDPFTYCGPCTVLEPGTDDLTDFQYPPGYKEPRIQPQVTCSGSPQITNALLSIGAFHGRTGQSLNPIGIVVHYVANPGSSAMANRNYFQNGSSGNGVSAHYIVGLQGEILRMIPENERAMHAGRSYGPQWNEQAARNNSTLLGIEVCHPDSSGRFSVVTYNALICLLADICRRRSFDPLRHVYRHYDVSGKMCPLYYINNPAAWTQMRNDIRNAMALPPAPPPVPPPPPAPSPWAKEAWEWGITKKITDGSRPQGASTREEVVTMLHRYSKL